MMFDRPTIFSFSPASCVVGEEWRDRTVIVHVSGDVDLLTVGNLATAIDTALQKRPTAMIVDLSGVDFLSSQGMSVLVDAREKAAHGAHIVAVADGPVTARPLRLTGIDQLVPIFPTLGEALTAVLG